MAKDLQRLSTPGQSSLLLPEKYLASAEICLPALQLAATQNIPESELIEGLGLSGDQLREPNCLLNTAQQLSFMQNMRACSKDPAIGLEVGIRANFSALGVFGLAMLSASSTREVLKLGGKYYHLGGTLATIHYREVGDEVAYDVVLPALEPDIQRYLAEEQLASFYAYASEFMGQDYIPRQGDKVVAEKVYFQHPCPVYVDRYQEIFRCELVFDADCTRMVYDRQLLDRPLALSNASASAMCASLCAKMIDERKEGDPLIDQIQRLLAQTPQDFPKIEQIADRLGIAERALRRRLAEAGTRYSQLLSDVKCNLAIELLRSEDLTVERISELLGYTEVTNFRRAFKTWTGHSPRSYRQTLRSSVSS